MQETCAMTLTTHVSQVVSSVIAAWADISDALTAGDPAVVEAVGGGLSSVTGVVSKLNVGYFWMFMNCATSAAYVSSHSSVRCTVNSRSITGIDNEEENQGNRFLGLGHDVLQQLAVDTGPRSGFDHRRGLGV